MVRLLPHHMQWAARLRVQRGGPLFGESVFHSPIKAPPPPPPPPEVTEEPPEPEASEPEPPAPVDEVTMAFDLLGLERPATKDEVRRAARRLAKKHHPDVGGDVTKFKAVMNARDLCFKHVEG